MLHSESRNRRTRLGLTVVGLVLPAWLPGAALAHDETADAGAKSAVTVKPVAAYALPHVPGKSVTLVHVTYAPGASSPPHKHAGAVTVYVLSGAVRSQVDDGAVVVYKPGETFFEPPGATHSVAANASTTEPAEILAVFVADEGATLTVPVK